MADVSPDRLRGFGLPQGLTPNNLWSAQATYDEADPQPGNAVAQGDYQLELQASGTQSASGELRIRTQRAGNPGPDGGAFVWRNNGDTDWRGADVQQLSAWEALVYTNSAALEAKDPDALTLPSGRVLLAYQKLTGSYIVRVSYRDPGDTSWTSVSAYSSTSIPTDGYHPALCLLPDGSVLLAHWVYDAVTTEAQIQTLRSTDSGATWSVVSRAALDSPLDIQGSEGAAAAGFEAERIRMAQAGGQILLIAERVANNTSATQRNGYIQAVSIDGGGRFVTVEADTPSAFQWNRHSVMVVDGQLFVMVITGNSALSAFALASATEPVSAAATAGFVSVTSSIDLVATSSGKRTKGEGSGWITDDGTIWWTGLSLTTSPESLFAIQSVDSGTSWRFVGSGASASGDGAQWFQSGDTGVRPDNVVGTGGAGRQIIAHQWISDVDDHGDHSIAVAYLGGYSTVTLPGLQTFASGYQRVGWTHTYLPLDEPDDISSGPWTLGGTDNATLTGGALQLVNSADQTCYDTGSNLGSDIAQGLIVRASFTAVSGGSTSTLDRAIRIRLADGTDDYEVTLRSSTSEIRLTDQNGGGTIGTVSTIDPSAGVDILIAMANSAVQLWWRARSTASDREWTAGPSTSSLTSNTGSPASRHLVEWGHCAGSSTATTDWYEVCYIDQEDLGVDLSEGITNPDDLAGREYAGEGRAVYVDDGVRITAIDGGAREGETYHIDTRYGYAIDRVFWSDSQTPRVGWRSTQDNSAMRIPLLLNPTEGTPGTNNQNLLGDLMFLHLAGVNFRDFTIEEYSGGWNTKATVTNAIGDALGFSGTRVNNTVTVPSVGPSPSEAIYLHENECVGWTLQLGTERYRITRNSSGTFSPGTHKRPVFEVEATSGGTSTGVLRLWPSSVTVLINLAGVQGSAWALNISAQHTYDDDYRIGQLALGRVFVPGRQYSRGRVVGYQTNTPTTITAGGVLRGRKLGPGGRELRIAWTDPVDETQLYGGSSPDYITGSTTSGSLPIAVQQDVYRSLEGVFRELGQHQPLVVLPAWDRSTGAGTDVITLNRRREHILATLTSGVESESVVGEESSTEAVRVSSITAREVR